MMRDKAGKSQEQIKKEKLPTYLVPIRYISSGVTVHDAEAVSPGVTLLTSHWPEYGWNAGLKLIDAEGNLLHQWNVNPGKIWALKTFIDANVHGSYLFPNGDVLFNIEYNGLVRLDACGEVIWKTDRKMKTHHSVFRAENGNFWVAGYQRIEKGNPRAKLFPAIRWLLSLLLQHFGLSGAISTLNPMLPSVPGTKLNTSPSDGIKLTWILPPTRETTSR